MDTCQRQPLLALDIGSAARWLLIRLADAGVDKLLLLLLLLQ
jgi:hypothetical protein